MTHSFFRILFATALVAACTHPDASAHDAQKPADAGDSSAAVHTEGGRVAASTLRDSISDRTDRGRIAGDSTARVWLIMASDFQCPFCKQWHDAAFAGIMQKYVSTGRVRLAFMNFPLGQHQNALPAAEAAMCAGVQNKFWPLHEALFATQTRWDTSKTPTPVFDSLATAAHVDMNLYHECVNKHLTMPMIEADRDRSKQYGANSTPTFIIVPGNQVLMGADANVGPALDAALAATGSPAGKPD